MTCPRCNLVAEHDTLLECIAALRARHELRAKQDAATAAAIQHAIDGHQVVIDALRVVLEGLR